VEAAELIAFEREVADRFERGEIRGPVHLSGGNEDQLIQVFKSIKRMDWVFSTWRNHYHALLHGVPAEKLKEEVFAGRGMNLYFPEHRFYTSAIVGGVLPIAVGVAYALKMQGCKRKVWCFVGDMAATTGIFHEASTYAEGHDLPIRFVIEDNGYSTNAPTEEVWGKHKEWNTNRYYYQRTFPHMGIGKWIQF
jgi:TPP-dependent pyruvate/acetoin dehydrogenase alpha subunit